MSHPHGHVYYRNCAGNADTYSATHDTEPSTAIKHDSMTDFTIRCRMSCLCLCAMQCYCIAVYACCVYNNNKVDDLLNYNGSNEGVLLCVLVVVDCMYGL